MTIFRSYILRVYRLPLRIEYCIYSSSQHSSVFGVILVRIQSEYGKYTEQNYSEYGHFSRSENGYNKTPCKKKII